MKYLTLNEIKKQLNVDEDYHGDDEFLEMLGDSAEDLASQLIDTDLDALCAAYGSIPSAVRHALRMLCDYMYSQNRGSSSESIDIPNAVFTILKLYRNFN